MLGSVLFEYQMLGGAPGALGSALFEYQMFGGARGTAWFGVVADGAGAAPVGGAMYGWPIIIGANQISGWGIPPWFGGIVTLGPVDGGNAQACARDGAAISS